MGISRSSPWFVIGDFNELTGNHEKRGGKLRPAASFRSFNCMIQDCGFLEFPYLGDYLSWRCWRDKKPIRCRLDRALENEDWHALFPDTVTEYLPMVASDHKPMLAYIGAKHPKGKRRFVFDRRWIGKEGLMSTISSGWGADGQNGQGLFVDKVVNCRQSISRWQKTQVPVRRDAIDLITRQLTEAQADDATSPETITDLTNQLREAYRDEEIYWYQKSQNRWMRVGNRNSKYFHAQTKQRRAQNRIVGLFDKNNVWSTDDEAICNTTVSYFQDLFSTIGPANCDEILGEIARVITDADNAFLTGPATEKELERLYL
ncbi:PREDICTED: uncharacterized protein LOC104715153 [Camelina sativa]|uniref:Uncharacterized protein LOC104715153 n=1 Tax=Camelina sativa TaxID=90675 RepID=A0ABM0TT26_CAMSA|nr:PREDICTED: uncharacterized protein LOC104715153 [Camelina sativa]